MLDATQAEVREWADRNFGDVPTWQPLMGAVEEVGELCHAHLKREQGIRGFDDPQQFLLAQEDALGDILVYLLDYCGREGISLQECLISTWDKVKLRDWTQNKQTGAAPA